MDTDARYTYCIVQSTDELSRLDDISDSDHIRTCLTAINAPQRMKYTVTGMLMVSPKSILDDRRIFPRKHLRKSLQCNTKFHSSQVAQSVMFNGHIFLLYCQNLVTEA